MRHGARAAAVTLALPFQRGPRLPEFALGRAVAPHHLGRGMLRRVRVRLVHHGAGAAFFIDSAAGRWEMGERSRAEPRTLFAGPFSSQTNLGATLQTLGHLSLARFSFALCCYQL